MLLRAALFGVPQSGKKEPSEVFDRIRATVLRCIQPDTTPPSPLLKSLQDAQVGPASTCACN
jgi:hypothetical protein